MHLAADGHVPPLALAVTAGQAGDAPVFEMVMARIRVPRTGSGRSRTRAAMVLADRAYSSRAIRSHLRPRGRPAAVGPDRPPTTARPPRWPPARLRCGVLQAAHHRRAVHQLPQPVARPGHTNDK
ncbi:transposase [Streptomyces sp. NPDC046727]|uniref:transposase n=1 Tax=Streptomyces sp. NPDC046727 TaxID=3155373 RepID=UPI0033CED7A9